MGHSGNSPLEFRVAPPCRRARRWLGGLILAMGLGMGQAEVRAAEWIDCDTGVPAATMQLFDAHNHLRINSAAEGEIALSVLATEGVSAGMIALGTLDDDELGAAIDLQDTSESAVFAYVGPPHFDDGSGNKTFTDDSLEYTQEALRDGARGIGELILRHSGPPTLAANIAADQSSAMDLYAEAALRRVPVSFHFEVRDKTDPGVDIESRVQELETALSSNPDTVFIWSHAGDTGPSLVREMVEDHPNLYVDLSTRNPQFDRSWPIGLQSLSSGVDGTGPLKTQWKDLFEDHPDRFLFGLDFSSPDRWAQREDVVNYFRDVLGQLSQETAEKIGCKNARTLLVSTVPPEVGTPLFIPLVFLLAASGALGLWLRSRWR